MARGSLEHRTGYVCRLIAGGEIQVSDMNPERRSGSDRRVGRHFRFLDRRTGFRRRNPHPVVHVVRESPWVLMTLLVLLNAFSLCDAFFTMLELQVGIAHEGNPVLGAILGASPLLAVVFKTLVMIGVSIMIWRGRKYRAILALAPSALAIYAAVLAYHLGSLNGLGWL
jgi:hypothetical protein